MTTIGRMPPYSWWSLGTKLSRSSLWLLNCEERNWLWSCCLLGERDWLDMWLWAVATSTTVAGSRVPPWCLRRYVVTAPGSNRVQARPAFSPSCLGGQK